MYTKEVFGVVVAIVTRWVGLVGYCQNLGCDVTLPSHMHALLPFCQSGEVCTMCKNEYASSEITFYTVLTNVEAMPLLVWVVVADHRVLRVPRCCTKLSSVQL